MFRRLFSTLALTTLFAFPAAAQATLGRQFIGDYRTPIRSLPFVIDEPGSYVLTADLEGVPIEPGVAVRASDVTIDLNGFTLRGAPNGVGLQGALGSGPGILVDGAFDRLTIYNGRLVGWSSGIDAVQGRDSRVRDVDSVLNLEFGIRVGERAFVEDCHASDNGATGIDGVDLVTIKNCVAVNHAVRGIRTGNSSFIVDCHVRNGGQMGIEAGPRSIVRSSRSEFNVGSPGVGIRSIEAGSVFDSTTNDNAGIGIQGGGRTIVRGCHSFQNAGRGIQVSDASIVEENLVNGSGQAAIFMNAFGIARGNMIHTNLNGVVSQLSLVEDNFVIGSTEVGILANGGDEVRDNVSMRNFVSGITVGQDAMVTGNYLRENPVGIIAGVDDARVSDNHIVQNTVGFRSFANDVTVYKNSFSDNGTTFDTGAGVDQGCSILADGDDAFGNIEQD